MNATSPEIRLALALAQAPDWAQTLVLAQILAVTGLSDPNQHSALGTAGAQPGAGTLGTPSEHVLGGHGAGLGTGTTGLQSGNGTGATGGTHGTGANYATGQAPGTNAAGVGSGHGNGSGLGPNAGGAGRASQSTGSGTTDIILGKLEQGAGMLLSNDKMRAKGLEKEAKGEAQRNASHSRELDQEATTLRERSAQKNNVGVGSGTGAGIGSAHDGKSGKRFNLNSVADEC